MIALSDPAVLYGGLDGFGHFVVIIGLEGDKIWYHDPDLKGNLLCKAMHSKLLVMCFRWQSSRF